MQYRTIILVLCAALIFGLFSGCTTASSSTDSEESTPVSETAAETVEETVSEGQASDIDLTNAVTITLSGDSAEIDGTGASLSDGVITISAAGTYVFSGTMSEGRILVDADGEDVTLVLNGADITCSYSSPLYIYDSASTTVHVMEGTENTLTDGETYTYEDSYSSEADEEPNACLYSKSDLILQGSGALTVYANFDNGITSKDTLEICDVTLSVTAVDNGIHGKDSSCIAGATITVSCGGDAIRSTNDTDTSLGWISISDSNLYLTAGEDGIQAETSLSISGGEYTVTAGGGSTVQPSDETSAKGLKGGASVTLDGGTYTLDCSDDAIHSNAEVTILDGVFTISSYDDAIHADDTLAVSGGEIQILTSYEGLEGASVDISGGTIRISSSDDGINAGGGTDSSGFGGFGPGNDFGSSDASYTITISGGYVYLEAGGDGLDSNGTIDMTGGTIIVSSTGMDDGAIDYERSFTLSGGTLLAMDSGNMGQTPSEATQYTVCIGFDTTLSAGTYVSLTGTDQSFVFQLPVDTSSLVFSSSELESGATYTVSYGGEYSGETTDGICSGGTFTGGETLTELTISDYLTSYGSLGMGGMGGMGGNRGGGMGGGRGDMDAAPGQAGETPPDMGDAPADPGEMPEPHTDEAQETTSDSQSEPEPVEN